jgi:hypothetical protein
MAVALLACGEVNKLPDAGAPDAYAPDSPSSAMCMPGEMSCNGVCADLMTSEQYCGNCNTQCPTTQGCLNGACVANYTDCARIKDIDPMASDGLYTHPTTGAFYFCDMTNRVQYSALSTILFTTTLPANYTQVRAADLASPVGSKAFTSLYNNQNGIPTQSMFMIGNCCIKVSAGIFMLLDGGWMGTNPCQATMNGTFRVSENGTAVPQPLPENHFTLNIPTEGATGSCGDNTNPMLVWQKKTF